jgi:hypothetical protein
MRGRIRIEPVAKTGVYHKSLLASSRTLNVWKLDRLGRDLRHLVNTVDDLNSRRIGLKVLTGHRAAINTTTEPQAGLRPLRRPDRVRGRADHRAHQGGAWPPPSAATAAGPSP